MVWVYPGIGSQHCNVAVECQKGYYRPCTMCDYLCLVVVTGVITGPVHCVAISVLWLLQGLLQAIYNVWLSVSCDCYRELYNGLPSVWACVLTTANIRETTPLTVKLERWRNEAME